MCCMHSKKIAKGHKDGSDRYRTGFSKTQGSPRGLRGAIWQEQPTIMRVWRKVQATGLRTLVYAMLSRNKHGYASPLLLIRSFRHAACRRLPRRVYSTLISQRFPLWSIIAWQDFP